MPLAQSPIIQPDLHARAEYRTLVEAATPVLAEAIGEPAGRVTAEWGVRYDPRGRPLITLTIRDWTGHATTEFAPDELAPPEKAWRRFYRLWGDLLERAARTHIGSPPEPEVVGGD